MFDFKIQVKQELEEMRKERESVLSVNYGYNYDHPQYLGKNKKSLSPSARASYYGRAYGYGNGYPGYGHLGYGYPYHGYGGYGAHPYFYDNGLYKDGVYPQPEFYRGLPRASSVDKKNRLNNRKMRKGSPYSHRNNLLENSQEDVQLSIVNV